MECLNALWDERGETEFQCTVTVLRSACLVVNIFRFFKFLNVPEVADVGERHLGETEETTLVLTTLGDCELNYKGSGCGGELVAGKTPLLVHVTGCSHTGSNVNVGKCKEVSELTVTVANLSFNIPLA